MRKAVQISGLILVGHLGFEEPRRDRVDPNALARAPLLGQVRVRPMIAALLAEYAACGRRRRW